MESKDEGERKHVTIMSKKNSMLLPAISQTKMDFELFHFLKTGIQLGNNDGGSIRSRLESMLLF